MIVLGRKDIANLVDKIKSKNENLEVFMVMEMIKSLS